MSFSRYALAGLTALSLTACKEEPNETPTSPSPAIQAEAHFHKEVLSTVKPSKPLPERLAELKTLYNIHVDLIPDLDLITERTREGYQQAWKKEDRAIAQRITKERVALAVHALPAQAAQKALDYLEKTLSAYPPFMLKKLGPKRINLVHSEMMTVPKDKGEPELVFFRDFSTEGGNTIMLNFDKEGVNISDNFPHELFHTFDQRTPGGWERDFERWVSTSTLVSDKTFKHKLFDPCFQEDVPKFEPYTKAFKLGQHCRTLFREVLKGYTHTYGYIREENVLQGDHASHVENKAVFGDMATRVETTDDLGLRWMVERAYEDKQVLTKLKLITGCDIVFQKTAKGIQGRFTRLLTAEEYAKLITVKGKPVTPTQFDYFRKWSTDDAGKVHMGPEYYNAILQKQPQ